MGQRLGIAGALLGDPRILMFDEPVNGLDPEGIHWIRNLMKSLAGQGRTVFVSSHLVSEMALTADHLVVIGQGRLLADTSMADFIAQNSRSYVRIRCQRERLLDVLHGAGITVVESGSGTLEVDGAKSEQIGELAAQHQIVLHELSPQQASLEEAFMRLTAESVEYHAHTDAPPGGRGSSWTRRPGAWRRPRSSSPSERRQDPVGRVHRLDAESRRGGHDRAGHPDLAAVEQRVRQDGREGPALLRPDVHQLRGDDPRSARDDRVRGARGRQRVRRRR